MLKYFVILAVLLSVCFCGCGDNLNPLESQGESSIQIEVKDLVAGYAEDPATIIHELPGDSLPQVTFVYMELAVTNKSNQEVILDNSSFSMKDIKDSTICFSRDVGLCDPVSPDAPEFRDTTSVEILLEQLLEYVLHWDLYPEVEFIIRPKATVLVGLFGVASSEPRGKLYLVYGNMEINIPIQTMITQAIATGHTIGDAKSGTKDGAGNVSNLSKEITSSDGAPMVLIPAGAFEGNGVHTVYLDAFYMDKYEVTRSRFKKFVDATGYKIDRFGGDIPFDATNYPISFLSWNDAKAYADWAGKRLPTNYEWDKAARGGLVGKKFPWGDVKPGNNHCNLEGADDGYDRIAPVGSFSPNGYGLYDMAGNVKEWGADWFKDDPDSGYRMARGGGWHDSDLGVSIMSGYAADSRWQKDDIGFRCVMDAK